MDNEDSFTVTQLTEQIKNTLKKYINKNLCITGEISNFKLSKNNLFFTLKDENSMINVRMWNYSNKKNNDIEEGKKVKIYGNLVIYGKAGSYNLNAYKIELIGIGDLYNEYIRLKNFYSDIGYFNESNKKKLPNNIKNIGILTAIDGAALQDFIYVVKKNNYNGNLYIKNCIVQGKDCPSSIIDGLNILDNMNLDVIVLARGGGSFEDLFGFSNNYVIEAIHDVKTCIISAIGHEIDFMLSDFAADIRAPTPSIAAEIITTINNNNYDKDKLNIIIQKIENYIYERINKLEYELMDIEKKLETPSNILKKLHKENELIKQILLNKIMDKINNIGTELNKITYLINKEDNPIEILTKGYCISTSIDDEKIKNIKDFINYTTKRI